MRWHPPIPSNKLYSGPAMELGPALAMLIWCYDGINRDGTIEVSLEQVAHDLGKPYRTIKDWWRQLRTGPFFVEKQDRGRLGWKVRLADDWIDWRIMKHNYPDAEGQKTVLEEKRPSPAQVPPKSHSSPAEGQNNGLENLHIGTHVFQYPDLSLNGSGMKNSQVPPPPSRGREDEELAEQNRQNEPSKLSAQTERAASEWLNQSLSPAQRRRLLALLGRYGADWLDDAITAAADQGGRTLKYLETMLEGCKAEGKRPGSPRRGTRGSNGRSANANLPSGPASRAQAEFEARLLSSNDDDDS